MGLHPFADAFDELALPVGQGDAGTVSRALGALQGVDGLALGGLPLSLEGAGTRLVRFRRGFAEQARLRLREPVLPRAEAGALQVQISPMAER